MWKTCCCIVLVFVIWGNDIFKLILMFLFHLETCKCFPSFLVSIPLCLVNGSDLSYQNISFRLWGLSLCQFKTGSVKPLSLAYNLNPALCQLRLDFSSECRKVWVSNKLLVESHRWEMIIWNLTNTITKLHFKSCNISVYMSSPHYNKCSTWPLNSKTAVFSWHSKDSAGWVLHCSKKHNKCLLGFFFAVTIHLYELLNISCSSSKEQNEDSSCIMPLGRKCLWANQMCLSSLCPPQRCTVCDDP